MIFRPGCETPGGNWRASPFWRSGVGRVTFSGRHLLDFAICLPCHRKVVEDIFHSNFRILQMKCSHSGIPRSKGDGDRLQHRAGRPRKLAPPNAIAHTTVQFSVAGWTAGGNWFLTDSIVKAGRIQSNQKTNRLMWIATPNWSGESTAAPNYTIIPVESNPHRISKSTD